MNNDCYCGGKLKQITVKIEFTEDKIEFTEGKTVVIYGIPAEECQECGAVIYHGSVLSRLDQIKKISLAYPGDSRVNYEDIVKALDEICIA